jgi:hypothetical protein
MISHSNENTWLVYEEEKNLEIEIDISDSEDLGMGEESWGNNGSEDEEMGERPLSKSDRFVASVEETFWSFNRSVKTNLKNTCNSLVHSSSFRILNPIFVIFTCTLAAFANTGAEIQKLHLQSNFLVASSCFCILTFFALELLKILQFKKTVNSNSTPNTKFTKVSLAFRFLPTLLYQISLLLFVWKLISIYENEYSEKWFNLILFIVLVNLVIDPIFLLELWGVYILGACIVAAFWFLIVMLIGIVCGIIDACKGTQEQEILEEDGLNSEHIGIPLTPKSFEQTVTFTQANYNTNTCNICLMDFEEGEEHIVSLTCSNNHIFHKDCMEKWWKRKQTCPICRDPQRNQH